MNLFYEIRDFRNNNVHERWLKIFYHDCSSRNYFSGEEEAKYNLNSKKFSILSNITNKYRINNKFEFIIYWPTLNRFYRWRQDFNPLFDLENKENKEASGFELKYPKNDLSFHGLVKTTLGDKFSLINGTPGEDTWYFSIGMYSGSAWEKIPVDSTETDRVSLWLLIDENLFHVSTCSSKKHNISIISCSIFIFIITIK